MARKPYEPTDKDRKQVTIMAGIGLSQEQIAKIIGISDDTLRKYFRDELDTAEAKMTAQVAQNLYSIATSRESGAVTAAIFWMKTRAQWRETNRTEVSGPNGGPIKVESVDLSHLSDEELEILDIALNGRSDDEDDDE
jgi:DNA-binding CsgD family transcriptional regulator